MRKHRDALLRDLDRVLDARWESLATTHFEKGAVPAHRVEFSKRITSSWALIYYRRHLVRLSPYLFLLEPEQLRQGSYWRELDATLRHELVHAYLFQTRRETGHPSDFKDHLARLGVDANGGCDRGPANRAYRHLYACEKCGQEWRRRVKLPGTYSCGKCAPDAFDPEARILLVQSLQTPYERLAAHTHRIAGALEEGVAALAKDNTALAAPSPRALTPESAEA